MNSVTYLIESGRPLALVKEHIAEVLRVRDEVGILCKELGVERITTCRWTGVLEYVVFPCVVPDGWTKPHRKYSVSAPKKGTDWHKRFKAQKGHRAAAEVIKEAFGVPTNISYTTDGGSGMTRLGNPFFPCGWMYLSADGPYALWVPDAVAELLSAQAAGKTVQNEDALQWRGVIPGARQIHDEEWDILVAQHKLTEKKKETAHV